MVNRGIISDILLWLALLVLAALIGLVIYNTQPHGTNIVLRFKDANELSRGANVRMMGIDVGYVKDIRLHKDHVMVIIKTFRGAPPIPSGSTFTVLFTGLVGSKSIEIVPPDIPRPSINGQPLYLVEEPIRLKDALNYQIDITQDLQAGAENIADFFGKKKSVEELQWNIRQADRSFENAIGTLARAGREMGALNNELSANADTGYTQMNRIIGELETVVARTRPETLKPKTEKVLATVNGMNRFLVNLHETAAVNKGVNKLTAVNAAINTRTTHWQQRVVAGPMTSVLDRIGSKQEAFAGFVASTRRFVPESALDSLQQARQTIEQFNGKLDTLIRKLDEAEAASCR